MGGCRRGFTLVELMVTMSIVVVLVALMGGAISAARGSAKTNTSANAVVRLDRIVTAHFRRCEARSVSPAIMESTRQSLGTSGTNPSAARAWHIRRNVITADMPDRWTDVKFMADNAAQFTSPAQAAYIATWNAFSDTQRTVPGTDEKQHVNFKYGGAECLFMIVMQGGFADCLDCNGLAQFKKGDKDQDGAFEFWDDWNNPIDYILWAPAYQASAATTPFFSPLDEAFPTKGAVRPGLGMRPLVYSPGADGKIGLERNGEKACLDRGTGPAGRDCGNPGDADTQTSGKASADGEAADNVVNVDLQAAS